MTLISRSRMFHARRPAALAGAVAVYALLAVVPPLTAQTAASGRWVGTWATAAQLPRLTLGPQAGREAISQFKDQTLRQIVHVSVGGSQVRVVFSNVLGTAPLVIGAAHVARHDKGPAIVPGTGGPLSFGGRPSMTIPPGTIGISDPVNLTVPPLSGLAIDLYLPNETGGATSPLTSHLGANQTNYISPAGNHTGAATMPVMTETQSWFLLGRVEVMAPEGTGVVVAFGDSITDGTRSTPDTNNRWPDHLARRLNAQKKEMGVLNVGIAGNQVLADGAGVSALARFDRDALVQPGVTHVILLEGINDIRRGMPQPTAEDLIVGYRQLIARAHARGVRIYGATLTPFEPSVWTPEKEAIRRAVNEWIRTSKMFDGVIDFDKATLDPSQPTKLRPKYDSGDNIHPSDAGYAAMANAVPLELLDVRRALTQTAR